MWSLGCLLWGFLLTLSTSSTEGFARAGRRVCAAGPRGQQSSHAESHVQPVYQPYLTTCQGHRLCSTYRTIYRVAYRQRYRQLPEPTASCCPGWSRANGYGLGCNRALCWEPCQNGGSCTFPGRCSCPPGWTGPACQTDVDECASQSHGCSQLCINTAGSFHCACHDGFSLAADDKGCQPLVPAPRTNTFSQTGASSEMREEVEDLRSRVEALEQQQSQLCSLPTLWLFQLFEHNQSPLSRAWWVLRPPGWSCWLGGHPHSSPSPCRSSSWCWLPSTTSCHRRMSVQTPSAACPTPCSSWTGLTP